MRWGLFWSICHDQSIKKADLSLEHFCAITDMFILFTCPTGIVRNRLFSGI
jgi:hypothetical protein